MASRTIRLLVLLRFPVSSWSFVDKPFFNGTDSNPYVFDRPVFINNFHALKVGGKLTFIHLGDVTSDSPLFLRLTTTANGATDKGFFSGDVANSRHKSSAQGEGH